MNDNISIKGFDEYEKVVADICANEKVRCTSAGKSIMGRPIYRLEVGNGEKAVALFGGAEGSWNESGLLLSFLCEFLTMWEKGRRVYSVSPSYISTYRRIVIYPMIDPDCAEYRLCGVSCDNPIRERLIKMNPSGEDFSQWRANGRGVSLERNSSVGFHKRKRYEDANEIFNGSSHSFSGNTPESEPEFIALSNGISGDGGIRVAVQISEGSDNIYTVSCEEKLRGCRRIYKSMQRISGLHPKESGSECNGIIEHIGQHLGICAYKLALSRFELDHVRELMYVLPMLV